MSLIRSAWALASFAFFIQLPVCWADQAKKQADIHELLKLQGGEASNREVREKDPHYGELATALTEIYDKRFSEEEINHLVEFFRKPVAMKFMKAFPEIKQESDEAIKAWGFKNGKPVDDILKP